MTTAAGVEASPLPYGPWAAAWAGLAALGVLNGLGRGLYQERIGEQRAHQVSTGTLVGAILPYAMLVDRRWPMPTARAAAGTGLTWVALTTAFEFGFGAMRRSRAGGPCSRTTTCAAGGCGRSRWRPPVPPRPQPGSCGGARPGTGRFTPECESRERGG